MESKIYFVSSTLRGCISSLDIIFSNLQKNDNNLHFHVYDDDVVSRDSIGSSKIDLKKHVFEKSVYNQWITHYRACLAAIPKVKSMSSLNIV
jgi:hypothetical protein